MSTQEDYARLGHAVQSGVKMQLELDIADGVDPDTRETSPKHLRVGVNLAMSDLGALAELLIDLNVITREQYEAAILKGLRREVSSYERSLSKRLGTNVSLG